MINESWLWPNEFENWISTKILTSVSYFNLYASSDIYSSHNLNIEIGRHSRLRIPLDPRFCIFCNSGEIDDELHFITASNYHSCERYTFFRIVDPIIKISGMANTFDKFVTIMSSKEP